MKTYSTKVGNDTFLYFYDRHIKLWTIYRIDPITGYQIDEEADHYHDKSQLVEFHPDLDFKKHEEIY